MLSAGCNSLIRPMSCRNTGICKSVPAKEENHCIGEASINRLYRAVYWKTPSVPIFKLPTRARKASITLRYDAKRKLKNVQHRQLSVHPSTHAPSPVSRASPQPSVPNIRVPLSVKTSCSRWYQAAGFAISEHTVCLSCQLSYLRISTPQRPLLPGLHASNVVLIFMLGICAPAIALSHDP